MSGDDIISADDLTMSGSSTVFAHVNAHVPAGGALIIIGAEGGGKTALMLALTGRMKFTSGTATVDGLNVAKKARAVRSIAALGPVKDVTDLDDNLTVEQHVAERIIMFNPWYKPFATKEHVLHTMRRIRSLSERVAALLESDSQTAVSGPAAVGSAADKPTTLTGGDFPGKTYVSDLSDLDRFLLSLALALLGSPRVVAVDDIDLLRRRSDRLKAWLYVLAGPQILGDELGTSPVPIVTCEDSSEMAEAVATVRRLGLRVPPLEQVRLTGDHGLAGPDTLPIAEQEA